MTIISVAGVGLQQGAVSSVRCVKAWVIPCSKSLQAILSALWSVLHGRDLLGDDATAFQSRHEVIIGCSSISLYDTATSNKAQEVVQRGAVPSVHLLSLVSVLQKGFCCQQDSVPG